MRETGEDLPELFFNVYVIDTAFKPIGYVPVSQLMRAQRGKKLSAFKTKTKKIFSRWRVFPMRVWRIRRWRP